MGTEEISGPPVATSDAQPPPAAEFDPFFARMYPALVKYGVVVWGSVPDAEEAAADAMNYLYRHWYAIENKEPYARTMVTRAIGRLRKDAARHARQLNQAGPVDPYAGHQDGTAVTECVQRRWITELLERLPPVQRAVMAGFFDQVPTADIAAALGKTEATVRKNLQLARQRLQQEVGRQRALDRIGPYGTATSTPRKETR